MQHCFGEFSCGGSRHARSNAGRCLAIALAGAIPSWVVGSCSFHTCIPCTDLAMQCQQKMHSALSGMRVPAALTPRRCTQRPRLLEPTTGHPPQPCIRDAPLRPPTFYSNHTPHHHFSLYNNEKSITMADREFRIASALSTYAKGAALRNYAAS